MGKKRIITESGIDPNVAEKKSAAATSSGKKRLVEGVVNIQATYNNTRLLLCDRAGNAIMWSTSGALGFNGAKKGTPFAAGRVAELLADKAQAMGLKEVDIVVKGVGAGREAAIRALSAKGLVVNSIKDATPIPFNGPRARKPRRV